jgi:hypothetical protein
VGDRVFLDRVTLEIRRGRQLIGITVSAWLAASAAGRPFAAGSLGRSVT